MMAALALDADHEHAKAVIELFDVVESPHQFRIAKRLSCCKSSAVVGRLLGKANQLPTRDRPCFVHMCSRRRLLFGAKRTPKVKEAMPHWAALGCDLKLRVQMKPVLDLRSSMEGLAW